MISKLFSHGLRPSAGFVRRLAPAVVFGLLVPAAQAMPAPAKALISPGLGTLFAWLFGF